jgi:uncharacterized membrane protein (DUF373 family)
MGAKETTRELVPWMAGLLVDAAVIVVGGWLIIIYSSEEAPGGHGLQIGIALLAAGVSLVLATATMLIYEATKKREMSRRFHVSLFLLLLILQCITIFLAVLEATGIKPYALSLMMTIGISLVSYALLVGGMSGLAKDIGDKGRFALSVMTLFLVLLAIIPVLLSAEDYLYREKEEQEHGYYGCPDELRTIDSAIMTYSAAHNGAYPESIKDLVPNYIKGISEGWQEGHIYSLDTSTDPPHAACTMGHTY